MAWFSLIVWVFPPSFSYFTNEEFLKSKETPSNSSNFEPYSQSWVLWPIPSIHSHGQWQTLWSTENMQYSHASPLICLFWKVRNSRAPNPVCLLSGLLAVTFLIYFGPQVYLSVLLPLPPSQTHDYLRMEYGIQKDLGNWICCCLCASHCKEHRDYKTKTDL